MYQDVGHYLHAVVVGVQGGVVAPAVELALAAAFGEEVGHGERLVGCYLTDDIGVLLEVDALLGVVPVVGQIAVEAISLARGTKDNARLLVTRENAVNELPVNGGKGAVLRVVDVVVDGADRRGVSPVIDAMLYGIVVGEGDLRNGRPEEISPWEADDCR